MPDDLLTRVPPQSLDSEMAVLGGIFIDNDAIDDVMADLLPVHFYREHNRIIYQAMLDLTNRDEPIDSVTITNALGGREALERVGGNDYLAEIISFVPSASNTAHYAEIVRDKALLREILSTTQRIAGEAYEATNAREFAANAAQEVAAVTDQSIRSNTVEAPELARLTRAGIEHAIDHRELITGVPSGIDALDALTTGFQNSELIIIAARPSMGKTALGLNIAAHAAIRNARRVLVCSLEMSHAQLGLRMACSEARVELSAARRGANDRQHVELMLACDRISDAQIVIDDSSTMTPLGIKALARRHSRPRRLDLVIVDYLQLMYASRKVDSREREVAEITRSLKALAKELDVPVIALSQLNRQSEGRDGHRPRLSDLRESGAIEQDADTIIFIHWDEYYKPPRERDLEKPANLILAKQRNGPTDDVEVAWIAPYARFDNLARGFQGE